MPQTATINRSIVLQQRPHGAPDADTFRLAESPVPVPQKDQLLLRTLMLSLDPYMRGRISDAKSYADPVAIGAVMVGGTVSRVEASRTPASKLASWCSATAAGRTMRCPTAPA